ncbi:MAG: hypothetical protein JRG71_05625 [Deltaproteobacteria bacterium]|nr:hypothetical protein [Deltaproteobacteria bacterium]
MVAKQLTIKQKEWIVDAIAKWIDDDDPAVKIKWNIVIEIVKAITGCEKTRAALSRHPEIKKAYEDRRSDIKPLSKQDSRLAKLEQKNTELKAENEALIEKFKTWAYNARNAVRVPMEEEDLNSPIPNPDAK